MGFRRGIVGSGPYKLTFSSCRMKEFRVQGVPHMSSLILTPKMRVSIQVGVRIRMCA